MHFVNYCISHYLAGFLAIAGFFVCSFVLMCVSMHRATREPPKQEPKPKSLAAFNSDAFHTLEGNLTEMIKRPE
jgi:hypothetical protein